MTHAKLPPPSLAARQFLPHKPNLFFIALEDKMRTMIKITMPVEAGNKGIQEGTLQKTIMEATEKLKPEAAYFLSDRGLRSALFVVDMKDSSDIPRIVEPFFLKLNAGVELFPVMNADDLRKGLEKIGS
jgi:hypothetical protein